MSAQFKQLFSILLWNAITQWLQLLLMIRDAPGLIPILAYPTEVSFPLNHTKGPISFDPSSRVYDLNPIHRWAEPKPEGLTGSPAHFHVSMSFQGEVIHT